MVGTKGIFVAWAGRSFFTLVCSAYSRPRHEVLVDAGCLLLCSDIPCCFVALLFSYAFC
jgi:hypothetical protein